MAFNCLTGLAVSEAYKHLKALRTEHSKSVIDFGNQRFRITESILRKIATDHKVKFKVPMSEPSFSGFTPHFYKQLGFSEYVAVDMNQKMSAIPMDLNTHLPTTYNYTKQHSLVIDNGTGEHVFDQHMVFKNQHDLCEIGGIILNNKPFFPYINHGFFNFQPVLFRDLAYANDYQHIFTWLGGNHGEYIDVTGNNDIWYEVTRGNPFWEKPKGKLEEMLYDKLLDKNNISIVVAYQKTSDASFKIPLQGKWVHSIDDNALKAKYGGQPDTYKEFHS